MEEVSDTPESGDDTDEHPLPTVHRRVMLTDLPPSGLADIARRLKLTLPEAEFIPAPPPPSEPEPAAEPARPGPLLADLPAAELDELARALLARVVDGHRPQGAEDLFAHFRGKLGDDQSRIDAFVHRVGDGKPVVIVRPSSAAGGARILRRILGATASDVWIGVPISMVLSAPPDLAEAAYYAVDIDD